jgi:hypothetical protein
MQGRSPLRTALDGRWVDPHPLPACPPAGPAACDTPRPVEPGLVLLAGIVTAAAVVAVSARDARLAVVGLVAVLALGPLVTDAIPDAVAIAARIVAATLAAVVLRLAMRGHPTTRGSRIGPAAEALAAVAAFIAGSAIALSGGVAAGPASAAGAGLAIAVLSLGPIADRSDIFRSGIGLLLLVEAADLLAVALAGRPGPLVELGLSFAIPAVAAAVAVTVARTVRVNDGLDPSVTLAPARRVEPAGDEAQG